jgi:DNA-binding transcriptional ArsR family regulator
LRIEGEIAANHRHRCNAIRLGFGVVQLEHADLHSTTWLTKVSERPIFNNMVEQQTSHLDSVFHALGDATRRQMLRDLSLRERTVSQLAEPFDMSLAAASKHIKALESAGLIRREVRGRTHICRLDAAPLSQANEWLKFYEHFWNSRLDELERLLRGGKSRVTHHKRKGRP